MYWINFPTLHVQICEYSSQQRQKINRSYFSDNFLHLLVAPWSLSDSQPVDVFLYNLDCSIELIVVKVISHEVVSCTLIETNPETVSLFNWRNKQVTSSNGDHRINVFKWPSWSLFVSNKSVQTTSKKICILGWIWKYMQESVGIYINCCKHISF